MKLLQFLVATALVATLVGLSGCSAKVSRAERAPAQHAERVTERPGIGTSWGETRVSWVEPTPFVRASRKPETKGMLYYNDQHGVDAMLDYLGGEPKANTGFQPAGDVSFGLRDGDGGWLPTWILKGKTFVAGQRGHRYEVVLKNETARPVEVVLSVDGLDSMDGQPASASKRGYVLDPREELAVEGFRTSDSSVAAFRFGAMGETYAQRKHGDTRNCGVVGVAVFREGRGKLPPDEPQPRRRSQTGGIPAARDYAKPPEA